MATQSDQVKVAGLSRRHVEKARKHEKSISMAGNSVFLSNRMMIMMRAIFERRDILDCVVCIDFLEAPPSIELQSAAEFIECSKSNDAENLSHTKEIIKRNQSSGNVTVACHSLGPYGEKDADGNPATAVLLKTFPGHSAPFGSWEGYQDDMKGSMPEDFRVYFENEELREEFLEEVAEMSKEQMGG
ncbi:hypothetical protein ACHAWF_004088 [Thalassiosira exigua]